MSENEKKDEGKFPFHPDFKWDISRQHRSDTGGKKWNVIPSINRKDMSGQAIIDYYSSEMGKRGWEKKKLSGSFHSGIIEFQKGGRACHIVFYRGTKEGTGSTHSKEGYQLEIRYEI